MTELLVSLVGAVCFGVILALTISYTLKLEEPDE